VQVLYDSPLQQIEREFQDLRNFAGCLGRANSSGLFFIYYSGHGTCDKGNTWGHTVKGEAFDLDQQVRNLSVCPNTLVISFFDCCRQVIDLDMQPKGVSGTTSTFGQFYSIYTALTRDVAISFKNATLSEGTYSFLEHMASPAGARPFPDNVQNWPDLVTRGYILTVKSTLRVHLLPINSPSFSNWLKKKHDKKETTTSTTSTNVKKDNPLQELQRWLHDEHLDRHFDTLRENGFESLKVFAEIEESELVMMGITKIGEKKALLMAAKQLKESQNRQK